MGVQLLARAAAGAPPVFASHAGTVTTTPLWFGPPGRPLLGWVSSPAGAVVTSRAALVCPPIGYEYWCSHRALRELAEALAGRGMTALRFDYDGTGDSGGDQWEPDRLGAWRASVREAAALLRDLGCDTLSLVGLRFGASLALLEAREVGAQAVACWAPVVSGRRYRRELELLGTGVPPEQGGPACEGGIVLAGFALSLATLEEIGALDLREPSEAPAPRVLVLDRPDRRDGWPLVEQLAARGVAAEHVALAGTEAILDVPAEDGVVPGSLLETITSWLAGPPPGSPEVATRRPAPATPATVSAPAPATSPLGGTRHGGAGPVSLDWAGGTVIEQVVALGDERCAAVWTMPAAPEHDATVVFLNSGSEPHVGPGRAWVEYARYLALHGIGAVRADFPGWGETPGAPGRPYDEVGARATSSMVRALHAAGKGCIVLAGLCAGAWVALESVRAEPVAGVVAINVQLYFRRGDPVEALLADTRARRAPQRRREELGRRTGWWTVCDLLGSRNVEGRALDALARGPTDVLLLFAEGDDGLQYLRNRLGRRLRAALSSGRLGLVEVPGIDHAMHRVWRRPAVAAAIADFAIGLGSR